MTAMKTGKVAVIIADACQQAFSVDVEPEIDYPEPQHGDFSTNVAMRLAADLKQSPQEVARQIMAAVQDPDIANVDVAGPGFINITMTDDYWLCELRGIDQNYAKNDLGKGQKVQVEFISANPTGPLTLGNARGGFIGDVLANVLACSGYAVTREYYFNDAGTQITKLLESVKAEAGLIEAEQRQYGGRYIQEVTQELRDALRSEKSDRTLKKLVTQAVFEKFIQPTIANMHIDFDVWFNERDVIEDGTLDHVIQLLTDQGYIFERDDAVWVNSGQLGDSREARVLIKADGNPTYLATDIAYHWNIFAARKFDMAIKELGPDHIGQFPSLKAIISVLFPEHELVMVGHQQLRLLQDGQEVTMSKRLGRFVTVQELIDEVGSDVARFFILMRAADTHMDFDLQLAREQSQKNPYYYVMYAYVRACSILAEAKKQQLTVGTSMKSLSDREKQLTRHFSRLPELIQDIVQQRSVHQLSFFGMEAAKLFHEYYESYKIIDMPPAEAAEKLYFIQRLQTAFEVYFEVFGLTPRQHM